MFKRRQQTIDAWGGKVLMCRTAMMNLDAEYRPRYNWQQLKLRATDWNIQLNRDRQQASGSHTRSEK